jgi:hypothetical protein
VQLKYCLVKNNYPIEQRTYKLINRRICFRLVIATLTTCILILVFITRSYADSGSGVSLQIPGTALFIKGKAPPGSFVTINDNGSTMTTVSVNKMGLFIIELEAVPAGINYLNLSYVDSMGIHSALSTISVSIQPLQQVTLSVFMPPTINISNNSILDGYTYPNSTVTVFLSNGQQYQTISNNAGYWSMEVSRLQLSTGRYTAYALGSDSSGESYLSTDISFSVIDSINFGTEPIAQPNVRIDITQINPSSELSNKRNNQATPGNKRLPNQASLSKSPTVAMRAKSNFVRQSIAPTTIIKYAALAAGLAIVVSALTTYGGLGASIYRNIMGKQAIIKALRHRH